MEEKKVKTAKIIRKDLTPDRDGNIRIGEPILQNESVYDAVGNLVEERSYDREGILVEHYIHKYNEQGRHIMKSSMDEEGNRIEIREIVWIDDKPGEEKIEYMDGSVNLIRYSYNENGELTGKEIIDPEDGFEGKELYVWEQGHLVSEEHYNWEKEKTFYRHMQVDEAGRLITSVNWQEGEDLQDWRYDYDESGKLSVSLRYNDAGHLLEKITYTYDGEGRLVQTVEEEARKYSQTNIQYDPAGRMIRQEETNGEGEVIAWVERSYSESGELREATLFRSGLGMRPDQRYRLEYDYQYE